VRILIAEDQQVMAMMLRSELEQLGHQIVVTHDGEDAWQVVVDGGVHVLVSDWVMPRLDGLSLCRRIRAARLDSYTYIILLTAKVGRGDRLEGLRAGADDFLTKPFDPEELAVRLEIAARIMSIHKVLGEQNAALADMANTDVLTGLANRRRFDAEIQKQVSLATRRCHPVGLLLADVDHFKAYNDAFGHLAGDEALRQVAGIIRSSLREHDIAARFGGEEFAAILPDADLPSACSVAERIREAIAAGPWTLRAVTASLGVASSGPTDLDGPTALLARADEALYCSKQRGRDRVTPAEKSQAGLLS
jgi:diguanylate cyclase (GGDEF)-like protein